MAVQPDGHSWPIRDLTPNAIDGRFLEKGGRQYC
jgi:hypothetical protein